MARRIFIPLALLVAMTSSGEVSAGMMTVQHLFPGLGDVQYQTAFDVGPGIDLATFHAFAYRDLDVEPIAGGFTFGVGMRSDFTFNSVQGNALRLIDSDGLFGPFQSVELLGSNIAGFDATRITFDLGSVTLRFSGLTVNTLSQVSIRVNAIPEPQSLAIVGTGLITLVGFGLGRRATKPGLRRRCSA